MTNIRDLVDKKLELADRYAVHQEIQRLVLDDVSYTFKPILSWY